MELDTNNVKINDYLALGGVAKNEWPEVPQGFCVFSNTKSACPDGWTKSSAFNGRTIRGTTGTPGGYGGSSTHTHVVAPSGIWADVYPGGGEAGWVLNGLSNNEASSWPPYRWVTICCKT